MGFSVLTPRRDPVAVDSLVIISAQEDGFRLRVAKFHFGPELLKRAKYLQVEPSFHLSFEVKLIKDLVAEGLAIGQSFTQCEKSALAHLLLKDDLFIVI